MRLLDEPDQKADNSGWELKQTKEDASFMRNSARILVALTLAAITLLTGCSGKKPAEPPATPAPVTSQDGTSAEAGNTLAKEQKEPLTSKPSTPVSVKWAEAPTASETDLNNAVVKAQQLLNSQKPKEALDLLKPLAGAKNREVQITLGMAFYGTKDIESAAEAYARAAEVDPKSAAAHTDLGNIYWAQGKFDLAADAYQKALQADPTYEPALTNYSAMLNALQRPLWAQRVLFDAVMKNPNSASLLVQLGNLQAISKNYNGARLSFQAALKIDPHNGAALTGLQNLPRQ